MAILGKACALLVASTALTCAKSAGITFAVDVSPVVHVAAPFSAVLHLPASLALKKGGVEARAYLVDGQGEETLLAKRKLSVAASGGVHLEHELEGLLVGCVVWQRHSHNSSSRSIQHSRRAGLYI